MMWLSPAQPRFPSRAIASAIAYSKSESDFSSEAERASDASATEASETVTSATDASAVRETGGAADSRASSMEASADGPGPNRGSTSFGALQPAKTRTAAAMRNSERRKLIQGFVRRRDPKASLGRQNARTALCFPQMASRSSARPRELLRPLSRSADRRTEQVQFEAVVGRKWGLSQSGARPRISSVPVSLPSSPR